MNRDRFKKLGILLLVLLTISGWIYSIFISGGLPGFYPLAIWYSRLISPLVSIAVLLSFQWWILLPVVALSLGSFLLYVRRRRIRLALTFLLLWPLLILAMLPAMEGLFAGQSLLVEPWNQMYRTAYSSLWLDDNYGDVLLFKCDRTGIFCQQVHEHYAFVGAEELTPMDYDADRDLFYFGKNPVLYVRTEKEQLCSVDVNANSYLSEEDGCSVEGRQSDDL